MSLRLSILFQLIFIISFSGRLLISIFFDVSNEEAYFRTATFFHSGDSHLESPLFQWIYYGFSQLDSPYWFRLPSVIFFSLSIVLIRFLGHQLFNVKTALYTIILLHFIPFITLNTSFTLPHSLFLFLFLSLWFTTLSYLERTSHIKAFLISLSLVAGYLTSPIFLFVTIPLLTEMLASDKLYKSIAQHGLSFCCGLACLIPAWIYSENYFTFDFLVNSTQSNLWSQQFQSILLWFSPWFLLAIVIIFFHVFFSQIYIRGHYRDGIKSSIIWSSPLVLLALFWHHEAQSMLIMMTSLVGLIMIFSFCLTTLHQGFNAVAWKTLAFACCFLSILFISSLQKVMSSGYQMDPSIEHKEENPLAQSVKKAILSEYVDHAGVQALIESWIKHRPEDANFLFTNSWQLASQMNAYSKDQVLCFNEKELRGYALWNGSQSLIGKNGYLIIKKNEKRSTLEAIRPYFRKLEHYKDIDINHQDKVIMQFIIFRCKALTRPFPS